MILGVRGCCAAASSNCSFSGGAPVVVDHARSLKASLQPQTGECSLLSYCMLTSHSDLYDSSIQDIHINHHPRRPPRPRLRQRPLTARPQPPNSPAFRLSPQGMTARLGGAGGRAADMNATLPALGAHARAPLDQRHLEVLHVDTCGQSLQETSEMSRVQRNALCAQGTGEDGAIPRGCFFTFSRIVPEARRSCAYARELDNQHSTYHIHHLRVRLAPSAPPRHCRRRCRFPAQK